MRELQKQSTEILLDSKKVETAVKIGGKWTGTKDINSIDFILALSEIKATQKEFDEVFKKGITGEYGNYYKLTPLIVCIWIRNSRKPKGLNLNNFHA